MAEVAALAAARAEKAAREPLPAAAIALEVVREPRAYMEPASAEMVLEAVMAARARRRAVVPKLARRSTAVKAAYRMAAGNMPARIAPTPAMAQSALAVSGA